MSKTLAERFFELKKEILDREYAFLNPEQRRAVFAPDGPLLILAGAGSGKTTVLVSRIEYLIRYGNTYAHETPPQRLGEEDIALLKQHLENPAPGTAPRVRALLARNPVAPWRVLAITFTNKAADELKERLNTRLGPDGLDIWAATFHSACVRILRQEIEKIGYSRYFTIYDTTDSKRVIKECTRQLGLDEKLYNPRALLSMISNAKNTELSPDAMYKESAHNSRLRHTAEIYAAYNAQLKKANALDFDDIIALTVRILREFPETRKAWTERFDHLLVDEYQDTNPLQYKLISLLRSSDGNLCVVGDDDQSIYRFRGATIENILLFEERFTGVTTVKLERNYRSTQNILDAANQVIVNNVGRKTKSLWTENGAGEKITVYRAYDESHEADYIANEIAQMNTNRGIGYNRFAVLYRTNAQSRAIESSMRVHRVPARVIGSVGFYDRKEIKDILAYLCVLVNPADNLRLKRIINEPKRAIGDVTVAAVENCAEAAGCSMLEACARAGEFEPLGRSREKLTGFARLIQNLIEFAGENPLNTLIDEILDKTGYDAALRADEQYEDKIEIISELNTAMIKYMQTEPEHSLFGFLERVSLLSDADYYEKGADTVSLMTLHSAKGLEFDHVFIPGMEEGMFPSSMSMTEEGGIEEERRLCYVGITRAKKTLTLLFARLRTIYGMTMQPQVSRFVGEIPLSLIEQKGVPQAQERAAAAFQTRQPEFTLRRAAIERAGTPPAAQAAGQGYEPGETVRHRVFGQGMILAVTPMGNDYMLEIDFEKGVKKVMANFANLQRITPSE